jgi:RNA polymerase sporulation-specific sigma factor
LYSRDGGFKVEFKTKEERDNFIEGNLGLVNKRVMALNGGILDNDLFQEGCCALIQAVDRFDKSKGFTFSTFAVSYIDGTIRTYKNKDCAIRPIHRRSGWDKAGVVSMEYVIAGDGDGEGEKAYKDILKAEGDFVEEILDNLKVDEIASIFNKRDREIIRLLAKGYGQVDAGKVLGLPQSTVVGVVRRIRKRLKEKILKEEGGRKSGI